MQDFLHEYQSCGGLRGTSVFRSPNRLQPVRRLTLKRYVFRLVLTEALCARQRRLAGRQYFRIVLRGKEVAIGVSRHAQRRVAHACLHGLEW